MGEYLQAATKKYLLRYGGDAFPNVFTHAKGSKIRDTSGREIIDFTSGQMCATIGHNHPEIIKAINQAGERAYHMFSGMIPDVVAKLAQELAQNWMPNNLNRSLFLSTGSESTEAALRLAKIYTGGYEVIALGGSWHGVTGAAASVSYASDRHGYGPTVPGTFILPEPNSYRPYIEAGSEEAEADAALDLGLKMFDMQSRGAPAAIIVEPVISAGGVLVPPKSFFKRLRKEADKRGMLLIFDEAQTAFGRIGARTAAEYFDATPDILCASKTLGGGLPLAATITNDEIEQTAHERGFTFYTSHVSDPLPATVGLAVLETLQREQLLQAAQTKGTFLRELLIGLQQKYDVIGDVRGLGMLMGVELVKDRTSKQPNHELGALTTKRCFELGLSMNIRRRAERGSVWRIAPPLTISENELEQGVSIMDQAIGESLNALARP
ncbi:aspartate aminotransferase family protein [Kiloniella sp. EL199]|uniref:aspartate aminotransferase family protein n=1 Tax=Kiloniella sp. EL199 TaxID=2107581 RepID=UPI000EA396F5|nr:aspartate aminotransferase family protein [Kiloniella sp. EL199]